MKRIHINVTVDDLAESVRFYQILFAAEPTVLKPDYAKWMLDDPRLNFAISTRATAAGIEHLGIQMETEEELLEVYGRLRAASEPVLEEGATTCCYAHSEKAWITDPQGVVWETFRTSGESATYGNNKDPEALRGAGACCTPQTPQGVCCTPKPELAADAPCCAGNAAA